ncbi:NADH-quinone oxidoreductase subunit M [Oculatella sp. LEGE 06141]|uniref:NADH-quinone oxidoreductase subunit M n=1 Tax=Oculatella sp. LEGE 06141 TaxID=1828648 RepID=UPI00187EAFE7|nr:NADH-quinone oxidoreductase subunit M [Oculatella sp. LEGE 06141]MBE9177744.1 NADH-quinone oxidoreductase subunit M [Oculatella sp. LEGE 06141]
MLSVLIWVPLVGAILISLLPDKPATSLARPVALTVALGLLVWTTVLGVQFDPGQPGMQFTEYLVWIETIGLNYHLGVDGLSLPLLCLNALLTVIAIWSSDRTILRPRFYYALILLLNVGVSGAFLAQDLLLFFLFYELELIPLYFLIIIWGGPQRGYAATKFLIYTAISGALILASFLGVVWLSGVSSFDYEPLRSQTLPLGAQTILLIGLLLGFGIKIPFFPLHTWLPDAHVEASTPVSVLLAGVLLKVGTYGLLRFGVGLFLDAWVYLAPWLAGWAAVSALYGASCAIAQQDMKKVVAYSSIAHMAFILLGASATTRLSLLATVCQMVSHGLISALLFLLVGVVAKKTGSRDVNYLRGLLNPEKGLPLIGSLMILGVMAGAGIPGMVGFVAEFLIFRGSFPIFPVQTLLCMVGTGLTAVYFLLMINRVFFGRLPVELANLPRVQWGDRLPSVALALLIIALGIQPNWLIRWSEPQIATLVTDYGQGKALRESLPIAAVLNAPNVPVAVPPSVLPVAPIEN